MAKDSITMHVAAWKVSHDVLDLLTAHGANVNARDANERTPLMLAVRACVESYWTALCSPRSVRALLGAGADASGASFPSGYDAVDELLACRLA